MVTIYGSISAESEEAYTFRPAYLLDRDPPLGEAVELPRDRVRITRRSRLGLDAVRLDGRTWSRLSETRIPVSERPGHVTEC